MSDVSLPPALAGGTTESVTTPSATTAAVATKSGGFILSFVGVCADAFMAFGSLPGYMMQMFEMIRVGPTFAATFSLGVPYLLITCLLLRVGFYFGKPYAAPLMVQAVAMLCVQIALVGASLDIAADGRVTSLTEYISAGPRDTSLANADPTGDSDGDGEATPAVNSTAIGTTKSPTIVDARPPRPGSGSVTLRASRSARSMSGELSGGSRALQVVEGGDSVSPPLEDSPSALVPVVVDSVGGNTVGEARHGGSAADAGVYTVDDEEDRIGAMLSGEARLAYFEAKHRVLDIVRHRVLPVVAPRITFSPPAALAGALCPPLVLGLFSTGRTALRFYAKLFAVLKLWLIVAFFALSPSTDPDRNVWSSRATTAVGFAALGLEAITVLPQALAMKRAHSVKGLTALLLATWVFGDLAKTIYFLQREQPWQFVFCGTSQLAIDAWVVGQIFRFGWNV